MKKLHLILICLFLSSFRLLSQIVSPQYVWSFDGAHTELREFRLISPDSLNSPVKESDFQEFVSEKGLKNPVKMGVSDIETVLAVVDKEGTRWILMPLKTFNKERNPESPEDQAEEEIMQFVWQILFGFSVHDLGYTEFKGKEQILAAERNMSRFLVKGTDYYGYSKATELDKEMAVSYRRLAAEPKAGFPGREERMGAFAFRYFELSDSLGKIAKQSYNEELFESMMSDSVAAADAAMAAEAMAAAADVDYNAKESYIEIAETLPETSVKWEEESYDFKSVKEGAEVTHQFRLRNTGKNDLVITNVKPSCGCTASYCTKEVIKPGETCEVVVVFNSAGKEGYQNKTVTVTGNFKGNINKVLKITGEVITKDQIEPENKKKKNRKEKMY